MFGDKIQWGAGMAHACVDTTSGAAVHAFSASPRCSLFSLCCPAMTGPSAPHPPQLRQLPPPSPAGSSYPRTVPTTATCLAGVVQHHRVVVGLPQARLALSPAGVLAPREPRHDDGGVGGEGHGEHSRRHNRHPGHPRTVSPSKGRRCCR